MGLLRNARSQNAFSSLDNINDCQPPQNACPAGAPLDQPCYLPVYQWQLGRQRTSQVAPCVAIADSPPPRPTGSCQHTDFGLSLRNDCLHELVVPELKHLHGAVQCLLLWLQPFVNAKR